MGYMRHHAIVVTGPMKAYSSESKGLEEVRVSCSRLAPDLVSGIIPGRINGLGSFLFAPQGSKEGWGHSNDGDAQRDKIIEYLDELRYEDGSTSFDYVEVQFGDDEGESKIIRDSDDRRRDAAAQAPKP